MLFLNLFVLIFLFFTFTLTIYAFYNMIYINLNFISIWIYLSLMLILGRAEAVNLTVVSPEQLLLEYKVSLSMTEFPPGLIQRVR